MIQPKWKFVCNLGDINVIDNSGFFIYVDETGTYDPEGEMLIPPMDDDSRQEWYIYRFALGRCIKLDGYLLPFAYQRDWPHDILKYEEWFAADLNDVAQCNGVSLEQLEDLFCSANPIDRAWAWRSIGEFWGFNNLDDYPLILSSEIEVRKRYQEELKVIKDGRLAIDAAKLQERFPQ